MFFDYTRGKLTHAFLNLLKNMQEQYSLAIFHKKFCEYFRKFSGPGGLALRTPIRPTPKNVSPRSKILATPMAPTQPPTFFIDFKVLFEFYKTRTVPEWLFDDLQNFHWNLAFLNFLWSFQISPSPEWLLSHEYPYLTKAINRST